ncbi:hypothetical protein CYY_007975 [Polysphondylium violaceum]|uniref:Altered inheritance of mitochondria protein 24, mitochondrial n=1 Tax=Polysphondylium violaceum TaxID=133409 RepID=A0A8J4UXN9_9MYCE|nr:hypothetical protein CYY_007975 [Polysphondylium violaceum]
MMSREIIHMTRNIIIQHLVYGSSLLGGATSTATSPIKPHSHHSQQKPYHRSKSTSTSGRTTQPSRNSSIEKLSKNSLIPLQNESLKGTASTFDWEIYGLESQVVQMSLKPGTSITAETGALLEMSSSIEMDTSARGGFLSSFKRMFTGQGLFLTKFVNTSPTEKGRITFSSPYISKILALQMSEYGGELICQKNAFLCGEDDVEIEPRFASKFKTGFFGGQGFILQKLRGSGMVFVHAGGSVIYRNLQQDEKIKVTTGSIVAFESTVSYDVEFVRGVKNILFSGEGLTLATMTGPGLIILQSLPFERLVHAIASTGIIGLSGSSGSSSGSSSSYNVQSGSESSSGKSQ